VVGSAHNERPAKIAVTRAIEESIARVINHPDVLEAAMGRWGIGTRNPTGWHRLCRPGLLCLDREAEAADDISALPWDEYTGKMGLFITASDKHRG